MTREDMDELIRLADLNPKINLVNIKEIGDSRGWFCDVLTPTGGASVNFFPYGINIIVNGAYPVNEQRFVKPLITKPEGNHIL